MEYYPQYYPYEELCKTGRQIIETKDLDNSNIDIHFYSIIMLKTSKHVIISYIESDVFVIIVKHYIKPFQ